MELLKGAIINNSNCNTRRPEYMYTAVMQTARVPPERPVLAVQRDMHKAGDRHYLAMAQAEIGRRILFPGWPGANGRAFGDFGRHVGLGTVQWYLRKYIIGTLAGLCEADMSDKTGRFGCRVRREYHGGGSTNEIYFPKPVIADLGTDMYIQESRLPLGPAAVPGIFRRIGRVVGS